MSIPAVANYLQTQIQTIASTPSGTLKCINGVTMAGLEVDFGQYPIVVLSYHSIGGVPMDNVTMGKSGAVEEQYAMIITLYLADENCAPSVAQARAVLFPDRLRAMFSGDWTLGGNCFNADFSTAADNLTPDDSGVCLYQKTGGKPMLQWALVITEFIAANAPANT